MNTKKRILDEALTLFSENGYGNVYVAQIAEAVGIKAPSLYKHYKSKQDIFNAILDEMKKSYDKQASMLNISGEDAVSDAEVYSDIGEDELVRMATGLFLYFLHDEYAQKFRKMLTIEQFRDNELARLLTKEYADDPLSFQSAMFSMLCEKGVLEKYDPDVMALHFYAPIYFLLTVCDREPQRETESTELLKRHIRQFSRVYGKGEKI